MVLIIGIGGRNPSKEILIGFARQKIAVFERFFSEVREKDIAAVVGDDIEAALVKFRNGACRSSFGVGFRGIGSCGGEGHGGERRISVIRLRWRGERQVRWGGSVGGWG